MYYNMAKNSTQQIIQDEKKIIGELQKNANKSINEIAKSCGFSRQKVWRIIKNLEKNNTIWGYTAVINEEKQDLSGYVVLIKRTNSPIRKEMLDKIIQRELVQKANKIGIQLITSIYTNGVYDWFISFNAKNIKDAKKFVEDLNILFEGYIGDIQLLQNMFVIQAGGIQNPEPEKLKELFHDLK